VRQGILGLGQSSQVGQRASAVVPQRGVARTDGEGLFEQSECLVPPLLADEVRETDLFAARLAVGRF